MSKKLKIKKTQREKEQNDHKILVQDTLNQIKKEFKRAKEEYERELKIQKQKDKDLNQTEEEKFARYLEMQKEKSDKELAERYLTLKKVEKEFEESRKRINSFPKKLENTIKQAENEIKASMGQQHKNELITLNQKMESERRIAQLKINSFEKTISTQNNEIKVLKQQFNEATKQVKDIAVTVIENKSDNKHIDSEILAQEKNIKKN